MQLILALVLSTAFADYPWLKKLAVCNAAIAGLDRRTGVMRFADAAATPRQKDVGSIYLGEHGSAFIGENGKRAGLWIVTERKAYFVDLENLPADTKQKGSGMWNLKVRMRGRPALHTAFAYFDQAEGPRKWTILTAAFENEVDALGEQQKAKQEVEAREMVTPELQKQMEAKIMTALESWKDTVAPKGSVVSDGTLQDILSEMAKSKSDKSSVADLEKRRLEREKEMVEGMAKCQNAIAGDKDFAAISGMMNLVQRTIATRNGLNPHRGDDLKPDTAL